MRQEFRHIMLCPLVILMGINVCHGQKLARGNVVDYLTGTAIPDSALSVNLLRPDSTFLDTAIINAVGEGRQRMTKIYAVIKKEGDYILSFSHPDYEPLYQLVHVKFYRKEFNPELGTFRMKRIMKRNLNELEVKASKIKFYFKNDTLVYNADAFMTQDGFMLDDVLKKMPGLEFKDGKIYSNGRLVNALLLNGKDFFNDDRETLLANLPAYMVKDVKVYEKTKDSLSLYERERNFEGLVMDVRLKREYNQSAMGSTELGGGTDERYMARLFGMKIHDLYRFSAYAGSNNVNSNDQVMGGYYTNIDDGPGEKKFHYAGLNYNVDEKDGRYSVSGSARVQASKESNNLFEAAERYYSDGNIFDYTGRNSLVRNFSVQTGHTFTLFQQTPWVMTVMPQVSYTRSTSRSESHSVSSDRSLGSFLSGRMADGLFSPELADTIGRLATNRMDSRERTPTHRNYQSLKLDKEIQFKHSTDLVNISGFASHSRDVSEMFNIYSVDYFRNSTLPSDFRRQYQDLYNDSWYCMASLNYFTIVTKKHHGLTASLGYTMNHTDANDALYNLAQLEGWGAESDLPLGSLPEGEVLEAAMDYRNSKRHIRHDNSYKAELNYEFSVKDFGFRAKAGYKVDDGRLTFLQKDNDAHPSRVMARPLVFLEHNKRVGSQKGWGYYLQYTLESVMAPLIYMVSQTNDANTLSIYRGNPDLKDMTSHTVNAGYTWKPQAMGEHSLTLSYLYHDNPISMAYYYDRESGRSVRTPMNTSNFQTIAPRLTNTVYLGKAGNHTLVNELLVQRTHCKAFSGTTMEEYLSEYSMHNTNLSEKLKYTFRSSDTKYSGTLMPYVKWMNSHSEKEGVRDVHAWHFGTQVSGQVELPWSVRLQTDVITTSRRGYDDHGMNDNEVLWNLNAIKSFGEKITLKLEGFDILNQRKSVEREMTSNGRIESVHNILRRYVMLHFVWKIDSKPRKT